MSIFSDWDEPLPLRAEGRFHRWALTFCNAQEKGTEAFFGEREARNSIRDSRVVLIKNEAATGL